MLNPTELVKDVGTLLEGEEAVQEGLIVYFQGSEIGRVNLPAGTIYHSTTATHRFSEATWLSYTTMMPSDGTDLVVSAELHRERIVASGTVKFDVFVTCSTSASLFCAFNPIIEASNHTIHMDHLPVAAFD